MSRQLLEMKRGLLLTFRIVGLIYLDRTGSRVGFEIVYAMIVFSMAINDFRKTWNAEFKSRTFTSYLKARSGS